MVSHLNTGISDKSAGSLQLCLPLKSHEKCPSFHISEDQQLGLSRTENFPPEWLMHDGLSRKDEKLGGRYTLLHAIYLIVPEVNHTSDVGHSNWWFCFLHHTNAWLLPLDRNPYENTKKIKISTHLKTLNCAHRFLLGPTYPSSNAVRLRMLHYVLMRFGSTGLFNLSLHTNCCMLS